MKKLLLILVLFMTVSAKPLINYYEIKGESCIERTHYKYPPLAYNNYKWYHTKSVCDNVLNEMFPLDKSKFAYWYEKTLRSIRFNVSTPYGLKIHTIWKNPYSFNFDYKNIKNTVIKKVCLNVSKKKNKFNKSMMESCLEYSSYEYEKDYKKTYCGSTFQNKNGTASTPSSCNSSSVWYETEL